MYGQGRRHRGGWGGGTAVPFAGATAPAGYTYVGPCRCGTGPNAYYQDASGRLVRSWQVLPPAPPAEDLKAQIESLKEEKARLERRVEDLEMLAKGKEAP